MNINEISFTSEVTTAGVNTDLESSLLDNSTPTFESSNLDLSSLDMDLTSEDMESSPEDLTLQGKCDKLVSYLGKRPAWVTSLNKRVTSSKLSMLTEALGFDVISEYNNQETFNILVNAISQGIVTGAGFPSEVKNPVKLHYLAGSDSDSIHVHKPSGTSLTMYKSTPAISSFQRDAVDSLSGFYKNQAVAFKGSLYSYVKDTCYIPMQKAKKNDAKAYLAFDNLTIAQDLLKSGNITAELDKLKALGASDARINNVAILAKSLKDNG